MHRTYLPLQKVFAGTTSCKVHRIVADGDVVVVEWHGESPLAPGGLYANDCRWVVRVKDEKLAEVQDTSTPRQSTRCSPETALSFQECIA
jgi:ketosteroid isomerase-like protein